MLPGKKAEQWQKISLTTLLTGLVSLSVLLTMSILLFASYQSKKKSLIDTTLTLNYSSAVKMSETIDSLFIAMQSSLRYSSSMLSNMNAMRTDEITANLELLRHSSNYFNSIAVVDETGMIRSVSPKTLGTNGKYIETEEAKAALASKKPYVSKPYISATTKRLIVFMSEPIYDENGIYRGYIGGTLYLQDKNVLNRIFASNPSDELGSYFYIVSSNGHVLFHRDTNRIGEDISANQVVRKLLNNQSGREVTVNLKGEELLAGYVNVPANGWGVVVVSSFRVVTEQLNGQLRSILMYTLPPFVLLLLVVISLASRLAKPFVSLANLVGKIGKEKIDLPEGKRHWNREADLLTEAIRYAIREIAEQTDQLTQEAMTDPLTGLTNRRTLEAIMHQWLEEKTAFSILMMDIDKFKSINDTYGHPAGDEVLKHFAGIISSSIRPGDVSCRYGGEEFIALIPHSSPEEAYWVAERIRKTLEQRVNPIGVKITVSSGISHYPTHSASAEMLVQLADQALYRAKKSGRNQTLIADVSELVPQ